MLLSVPIVFKPAVTGGWRPGWRRQASHSGLLHLSVWTAPWPLSSCGPWGDVSLNFPCFLSSALASKLCLKPAELNLPRLTTVYAGWSYITAVAAFHFVLIQTPCSKRPWKSNLPFGAIHGWLDDVSLNFFFLNTVTIIPLSWLWCR